MDQPRDSHESRPEAAAPARREWSTPVIVAYGHLAKLTRGTSGNMGEASGMMPCL